jgi:hypothetical protein
MQFHYHFMQFQIDVFHQKLFRYHYFIMSGDPLTMDYFDNFGNGPLNKYKKSLK